MTDFVARIERQRNPGSRSRTATAVLDFTSFNPGYFPISYVWMRTSENVMTESNHSDIVRLPFERAIEELESIVKRLEEGKVPLEESVTIYERGEALKRRCEELLRLAEARVEKITLDAAGRPTGTEPLDVK